MGKFRVSYEHSEHMSKNTQVSLKSTSYDSMPLRSGRSAK